MPAAGPRYRVNAESSSAGGLPHSVGGRPSDFWPEVEEKREGVKSALDSYLAK